MRLFCHISEFEENGWESLPVMLFCSERVTLWSPSASSVNAAYLSGRSIFRAGEILELVREGYIQVMGRRQWLTDPEVRRQSNYPHARWDPTFDTAISDIGLAEKKNNILTLHRRVLFVGPEDGYHWADQVLNSNNAGGSYSSRDCCISP